MMSVLIAGLVIGVLGIIIAIILAYASKKFYIEIDPKIDAIAEVLPGANCGACGFAGCANYADSIVTKGMEINKCAPGGQNAVNSIASIMGIKASTQERKVAVIRCQSGGLNNTAQRYKYVGAETCKAAVNVASGPNLCSWGCVGQNDCVKACVFDAIIVDENNMRTIDLEKCTGCGNCVKACPRVLIKLAPISRKVHILCSSKDKGPLAKKSCGTNTACIGCGLCAKKCPVQAIKVENNIAILDYELCINCGLCATVCPTKAILDCMAPRKKASIIAENCIGCTICAKNCPVNAIKGELKQVHVVDQDNCIGCEVCVSKCPKKTIVMR